MTSTHLTDVDLTENEGRENPPVAPVWTIEEAELVWRTLDAHYKANDNGTHGPLKRIVVDLQKQWLDGQVANLHEVFTVQTGETEAYEGK